jgi:hypothetical protein
VGEFQGVNDLFTPFDPDGLFFDFQGIPFAVEKVLIRIFRVLKG